MTNTGATAAPSMLRPAAPGRIIPFASWERVSTEDRQDPESSRAWQYARGKALIEPFGGVIVVEFFDIDKSRSIPPQRRPEASKLLAALADPNRGFDAVVVGEPQRAFYGNQFGNTFPLFEHYGVPLWVPEVGGPIDPANEAHDLIMSVFGGVSKGERNRIKVRVRAAMATQAQMEGRYLGGRPPYGYVLIDAGPHPNPAKAADGKRLHVLAIDEYAAAVVERIFAEFLAGAGIYAIAERLTAEGIPCPSAHDRDRNRHRCGLAWSKSAVRAILLNPRYTGRQVWNRQRKDEVLIDVQDVALGHTTKMRWNDQDRWIYSEQVVHPPIIDEETFAQAQQLLAAKNARKVIRRPRTTPRAYVLRGVLFCGICHRRMQGSWNNGQPYYRCTFPNEYALANHIRHPRAVYVREAEVVPELDTWLTKTLNPRHLPATLAALAAGQHSEPSPEVASLREEVAACGRQLAQYRATLDAGGDPLVVGQWITETQARKLAAEARLRASDATGPVPGRMTRQEIAAVVDTLTGLMEVLRSAEPADRADIYTALGLRMTYHPGPGPRTVTASVEPGRSCTKGSCPRGERTHKPMRAGRRVRDRASAMTEQADKWIKWTTTGCLALLALIAGTVSYLHMHTIVALHRQPGWVAALTALSVDGMIAAASATLLAESRSEQRGALLPWALLVAGSQAANVAAAERTLIGRVIAAWPSFALTASYELLTRQVRRNVTIAERGNNAEVSRLSQALARPGAERRLAPVRSVSPSKVGDRHAGRDLQRRAWQRVLVNRDPMARFRTAAQSPAVRSPRTLGRLAKRPA